MGRPFRSPDPVTEETGVTCPVGAEIMVSSADPATLVPHRLQNVDPGGMRFPHLPQNDPSGSDVVSTGFGGRWLVSTTIFFMGRGASIFFFIPGEPGCSCRLSSGT